MITPVSSRSPFLLQVNVKSWRLVAEHGSENSYVPVARLIDAALHRITEWQGLEGTSGDHLVQPPAEAGSPKAGCIGSHPGWFLISPEKDIPQCLWAACSRALSPSK